MDKPRHPQVIRTWKVERIRKPAEQRVKTHQPKPRNKARIPGNSNSAPDTGGVPEPRSASPIGRSIK